MIEAIFWFAVIILLYIYFGYPLIVIVLAKCKAKPVKKGSITFPVTLIIAAHNEEKHIGKKIENTLSLDYPKEKLEIIIVSDGSSDGTDDTVRKYADRGIKLLVLGKRSGKTEAQNKAIEMAKGEVVLFSDATAIYKPDVIKKLIRNFSDPQVGCVTGQVTFRNIGKNLTGKGLKSRLNYEIYLRSKLSNIHSMFGATGCIYAIRRELCEPLPDDLVSDLAAPLKVLEKGFRTVYEPEALAIVDRPTLAQGEFARRSRIVLQGLRTLFYMRHLINPFKYGFFVSSMFTHRLVRWLAPIFLLAIFFINLALVGHQLYKFLFLSQLILYSGALVGFVLEKRHHKIGLFSIPFYFCLLNASAFMGLIRMLRGETGEVWEQVGR